MLGRLFRLFGRRRLELPPADSVTARNCLPVLHITDALARQYAADALLGRLPEEIA